MVSEKSQEKEFKRHFGELSDELLDRFSSIHSYCIICVKVLCNDLF